MIITDYKFHIEEKEIFIVLKSENFSAIIAFSISFYYLNGLQVKSLMTPMSGQD